MTEIINKDLTLTNEKKEKNNFTKIEKLMLLH